MKAREFIRKYHPLFHLRQFSAFQKLTRCFDIPVRIRFASISHPVFVSLSKNLSFVLSRDEGGEDSERRNFARLVKSGRFHSFFDIGANIGLYGFIFKTIVADGVVTMFEPDEDNAELIRRTTARAGLGGVELVVAAVSDCEGRLMFYKDELSGATGSIQRDGSKSFVFIHHHYRPREVSVRSVTLDGLSTSFGDPDLIKLDVEGAELRVLQGSRKLLERSRPALIFECDDNEASIRSFLSQRGYVFFDFSSMRIVKQLAHNNLALHRIHHAALLPNISE